MKGLKILSLSHRKTYTFSSYIARRALCNFAVRTKDVFRDDTDYLAVREGDPFPGDANEKLKGWELVMKRAHDVIQEISERQFNTTLHIYPDSEFVKGFGQSTKFSIAGCTSSKETYDMTKEMIQYQDSVSLVDFTNPLPYRYHAFQLVIGLAHPERDCKTGPLVPLEEVARILNNDGFGIIGATSQIWRNGMSDSLDYLHNTGKLRILSISHTEVDDSRCLYYTALVRGI